MVIPILLTIVFFILAVFYLLIPYMKDALMDKKRELIYELVSTVHSSFTGLENKVKSGELNREKAQSLALDHLRLLRYGFENENYFWVHDVKLNILAHPFPELEGKKGITVTEPVPGGRKIFIEMFEMLKKNDEGYIDYVWQSPEDADDIVPMLTYVRLFEPWDWVIGTGISFVDVYVEIMLITEKITRTMIVILILIIALLSYNVWMGVETEKSKEKYKAMVKKKKK